MPYCRKCGKEVKPDAKFCDACGTPLEPEGNRKIPDTEGNPLGRGGKHTAIWITGFICATAVVITLLILVFQRGKGTGNGKEDAEVTASAGTQEQTQDISENSEDKKDQSETMAAAVTAEQVAGVWLCRDKTTPAAITSDGTIYMYHFNQGREEPYIEGSYTIIEGNTLEIRWKDGNGEESEPEKWDCECSGDTLKLADITFERFKDKPEGLTGAWLDVESHPGRPFLYVYTEDGMWWKDDMFVSYMKQKAGSYSVMIEDKGYFFAYEIEDDELRVASMQTGDELENLKRFDSTSTPVVETDDKEESNTLPFVAERFTLEIPASWAKHYNVEHGEDYYCIYNTENHDAGFGGTLFTIGMYREKGEWESLPSYEELGEKDGIYYIAYFPTDACFSQEDNLKDLYYSMRDEVDDVLDSFTIR